MTAPKPNRNRLTLECMETEFPAFTAPIPADYHFGSSEVAVAKHRLPDEVYDKYRRQVMEELGMRGHIGLKHFLVQLIGQNDFIAAYFTPAPITIQRFKGRQSGGLNTGAFGEHIELDGWNYRQALKIAQRSQNLAGVQIEDRPLLKMAAFVLPAGMLRMWDIVERSGKPPMEYLNSQYGHAYSRYARSLLIQKPLTSLRMVDPSSESVMRRLLDDIALTQSNSLQEDRKVQRMGAALAWCQVQWRQALTQRPSMRS